MKANNSEFDDTKRIKCSGSVETLVLNSRESPLYSETFILVQKNKYLTNLLTLLAIHNRAN